MPVWNVNTPVTFHRRTGRAKRQQMPYARPNQPQQKDLPTTSTDSDSSLQERDEAFLLYRMC
jgi:hypothetical protein